MGKSGGRKKKGGRGGGSSQVNSSEHSGSSKPSVNGDVDFDASIFLKRAHELKDEGNKKFQSRDYVGALEQYDNGLKLIPKNHADRAVLHSNRAACLMQMKPIDYNEVIAECSMALKVQPGFTRALLRRARAFEAVGKFEMAMQDVSVLLGADPNHKDAAEISRRLKAALGPQQDLQSRPSPAALGASAALGGPIAGLGPCLPARPVHKKGSSASPVGPVTLSNTTSNNNSRLERSQMNVATENGHESKTQMSKVALKPSNYSSKASKVVDQSSSAAVSTKARGAQAQEKRIQWRPLKFVYDHDIRLGQMPVNCGFKVLREIVRTRFPSSKAVLIKYKDSDGDLVTITSTAELRLAEAAVDSVLTKEPESEKSDSVGMLRLHVVEVNPDQEPSLPEQEEEEDEEVKSTEEENDSQSPQSESLTEAENNTEKITEEKEVEKEKIEDPEAKEMEMDDWLFDFAQLFRTHVGIDPDAHIDLHELGMELCSEALEETVTSKEAQILFDKASAKFQEVAALAFFNWGNVHMCAARKRIPLDESAGKEVVAAQLQAAYEWVKERYMLAKEKYEHALVIKPDFHEGLLALGQQQFEMAKLHWSYALARKIDLSGWEPTETLELFNSAEEKMKAATEMWEKLEQQRINDLKNPISSKKEEILKSRRKKQGEGQEGENSETITAEEAEEQAAAMRSQIHLFWGNMLFERSQVECKIGLNGWKNNLDGAVERFKLAGASEADISMVVKNHCSNEAAVEKSAEKGT